MGELVVAGVVMGLAGTVAMDLWGLLLERLCGIGRPNWAFVGRWVATLRSGRVFHDAIAGVPEVPSEAAIGWVEIVSFAKVGRSYVGNDGTVIVIRVPMLRTIRVKGQFNT